MAARRPTERRIDIAPFAHRQGPLELWWEEPRDIEQVMLTFPKKAPSARRVGISYWQSRWPHERWERAVSKDVGRFGWSGMDDWSNGEYRTAAIRARRSAGRTVLSFLRLTEEFPEESDYAVGFRRTMKLRIEVPEGVPAPKGITVLTQSPVREMELKVYCRDVRAGPAGLPRTRIEPYNCELLSVSAGGRKLRVHKDGTLPLPGGRQRYGIRMRLAFMEAGQYSGDDPRLTLHLRSDRGEKGFTFDPRDVQRGERLFVPHVAGGVLVTHADDEASYTECEKTVGRDTRDLHARVLDRPEQTLGRALRGMPGPDLTYYFVGCKHSPFKFMVSADGDLTAGQHRQRDGLPFRKLAFGLADLSRRGRFPAEGALPVLTSVFGDGTLTLTQKVLATPLEGSILRGEPPNGSPVVALVRFEFLNSGEEPAPARLLLRGFAIPGGWYDRSEETVVLGLEGHRAWADGAYGRRLLFALSSEGAGRLSPEGAVGSTSRSARSGAVGSTSRSARSGSVGSTSRSARSGAGLVYTAEVPPGGSLVEVFKMPAGMSESEETLSALDAKEFDHEEREVLEYWRGATRRGCDLRTGEPVLDEFHRSHLAHVFITDDAVPEGDMVNTCVGTLAYGNYPNESCMIINDLDQRGLHEEARCRLDVYLRYQGTAALPGTFTDSDGLFYGCGGYECGGYNQHHGWVLWCMGEHYRLTGDDEWLRSAADKIVAGCDWVARQRENTKGTDPAGRRAPEHGFLPAGSLEDVKDFHFWLSTNALTWWGLDSAARALAETGHPEGERLVREAGAFADDLRAGFARSRLYSPVVKLRDGTWIPHFPSRLYLRGRDYGWIREVLEGALYLLFTGLYDPASPEGNWILRDHEDNRYVRPPYGYPMHMFEEQWFDRGGFSMQPNLLPSPVPYLERDEIEHFLRAYFNSFASCFRPDLTLLVEHPLPVLGATGGSHFKTSDEANSARWLRSMFVHVIGDELHIGRAVPRRWFMRGRKMWLKGTATRFGRCSVEFDPVEADGRMTCRVQLEARCEPARILVRFRHPEKKRLVGVLVDGAAHEEFDPEREWVILRSAPSPVSIEAFFQ